MSTSRYRFVVEAILFLTYATFGLSWIAVTPLLGDLQSAFHVSMAQLGMMTTSVSVAKVVAPLLTGMLAVRFGIKRTILFGGVLITFSMLSPFASSFRMFLLSRFVFGFGGAVVVTLLGPMVMQWFPKNELPIVNALNNVAVNTGIAVTLFTTVPLAARLGWRQTLFAYACLSVALTVAWAVFGRNRDALPVGPAAKVSTVRYLDVWRMRETWIVALAFTAPLALYLALNTWLPRFYVEAFGMSKAAASRYTGLFNLVGIPAAVAGGFLTRWIGLRRPFIIGAGLVLGFAAFGMFSINRPEVILISAVLLGMSFFIATSPLITTAMELPGVTPAHVSLIMGTMFSFAYLFGSLSPIVVGLLRDRTGSLVPGLSLWAAFSGVLLFCGLLLPETGPRAYVRPSSGRASRWERRTQSSTSNGGPATPVG